MAEAAVLLAPDPETRKVPCHPTPDSGGDGIELIGDGTDGVLSHLLLDLYQQRGYDRGYQRAVKDVLGSLVWTTEQYLGRQNPSPEAAADLRRALYGFAEHLERHLETLSHDGGYVSGGLGI